MYLLLNMLVEFLSIKTYQDNFFNDCSQVAEYHFYIKNIKWDSQPLTYFFVKYLNLKIPSTSGYSAVWRSLQQDFFGFTKNNCFYFQNIWM